MTSRLRNKYLILLTAPYPQLQLRPVQIFHIVPKKTVENIHHNRFKHHREKSNIIPSQNTKILSHSCHGPTV